MAVIPPWALPVDSVSVDSLASDSLAADSLAVDTISGNEAAGLILEQPVIDNVAPKDVDTGMSWVYAGLMLLFCVAGMRFKNSSRYLRALLVDLTDTRERSNVFDDTVKETSFLVLLNLVWVASAGVLLWQAVTALPRDPSCSLSIPDSPARGIGLCVLMSLVYQCAMFVAYWMIGNVFTDSRRTGLWLKGAAASSALESILLLPVAFLTLCQPEWTHVLLIIAASVFILGKIVFIFKGFRIFFTQFSSWLLFLYYLCSLEIVPLILIYVTTLQVCSEWL